MKKRTLSLILVGIMLLMHTYIPVAADSVGYYYYQNNKARYIIKRQVLCDNKTIDLSTAPALVIDGYNYIPAKQIISSIAGLNGSFSNSDKKVSMTFGSQTLVLTADSLQASLNGSTITLTRKPVMLKFSTSGTEQLYIPAKEAMQYLGFTYSYENSGKKIILTSPEEEKEESFTPTITLSRPSTISKGSVTCTDDYHNKRFILSVDGNYTTYFTNNKPSLPSGVTYSVAYDSASKKTNIIFTTSTINGWKMREDNSKIYLLNGTPSKIFKNIIVLDPGHGGSDPGACYGTTYKEADFTLGIVLAAIEQFEGNGDYKVYSTRLSNSLPSGINKVWDRRTFANNLDADIFISVHINSYNSVSSGTETIYNSNHNVKNDGGLSCYKLASIVQSYLLKATGFKDRGIKSDSTLSVLIRNNYPAVLTEVGFISNYSEAKTMANNLDNYGIALYKAIIEASEQYPTGR